MQTGWFASTEGPIRLTGAALLLACGLGSSHAIEYPTRPVTVIVSHVPGGPSDVIARILGRMLSGTLRQPIVVENRPGAAGQFAAEQAAEAPADGYTLLMGSTGILTVSPSRQKQARVDPELDFVPVTLIGTQANVLVVNPALPALSLAHLIEIARARPGFVTFASAGHGSASHLAGELFKAEAKIDTVHVPYKKPAPALQDVVAGHVQMMFAPAALVAGHVRAGRLRALGVATATRSRSLPGIATLDEQGLSGFDATTWYGLVAPAGTPKEVIDILHHATATAIDDPASRKIMSGLGIDVVGSGPREFDTFIKTQIRKWAAIVRSISTQTH